MSNTIEHSGTIIHIAGPRIDVAITPQDACASCKVKTICGMDGQDDKIVSVNVDDPAFFQIGQQVNVEVSRAMGFKAVFLAYLIPFVILLLTLLVMTYLGLPETWVGLGSLGAAALYYLVLYFFRNHIEKEIVFKIKRI